MKVNFSRKLTLAQTVKISILVYKKNAIRSKSINKKKNHGSLKQVSISRFHIYLYHISTIKLFSDESDSICYLAVNFPWESDISLDSSYL